MTRDEDARGRPTPLPTHDPDEMAPGGLVSHENESLMPSASDLRAEDSARPPFLNNKSEDDDADDFDEGDDVFVDVEGFSRNDSFDFGVEYMIPLSSTLAREQTEMPKSVNLFTGLGLIIGMCIGSGIFASPGPVLARTGSGWAAE
ncbi:hypothetical protein HDU67_003956 [Dinochytrium kinnereticum]|nr:hypothetical protein HDU67_003956 [Dinochytrium kinnereticum]